MKVNNEARDLQIQNWFQESIAGRQCGRPLPSRSLSPTARATSGFSANAPRPLMMGSFLSDPLHLVERGSSKVWGEKDKERRFYCPKCRRSLRSGKDFCSRSPSAPMNRQAVNTVGKDSWCVQASFTAKQKCWLNNVNRCSTLWEQNDMFLSFKYGKLLNLTLFSSLFSPVKEASKGTFTSLNNVTVPSDSYRVPQ